MTEEKTKSDWEIRYEKVRAVRQIMEDIENSHPNEEYNPPKGQNHVRVKFPENIDFDKLAELDPERVRKGFEIIDEKYPWKFSSLYGGEDTPRYDGKNYHRLVQYAPKIIKVLDIVKERCPKPHSSFEGDEQVKSITEFETATFEQVYPHIKKAAFARARPNGFLGTLGKILENVDNARNSNYLEEKVKKLEEKHQEEVIKITDAWCEGSRYRHYEDDDQRKKEVKALEDKLKKNKTDVEKRAAYSQHIRELGRLEGLDLDHVAKSLISLYRQSASEGVNGAFDCSPNYEFVKNVQFGLATPLYFEISFNELVEKMKKSAKLGVSPNTYANLICDFMNDSRGFEFDSRKAFEKDLFRFFAQIRDVTDTPNDYIANSLLANRKKRRSLPETIGYEDAKEFAIVSASYGIDPKNIETLVAQYSSGCW